MDPHCHVDCQHVALRSTHRATTHLIGQAMWISKTICLGSFGNRLSFMSHFYGTLKKSVDGCDLPFNCSSLQITHKPAKPADSNCGQSSWHKNWERFKQQLPIMTEHPNSFQMGLYLCGGTSKMSILEMRLKRNMSICLGGVGTKFCVFKSR